MHLMGWLSKLFGCSNRGVLGERCNCRDQTDHTAENHHAISLSEDWKGERLIDRELQLQGDELGRTVQESLDTEYQPEPLSGIDYGTGYGYGYAADNLYQPISLPYSTSFGICAGCNMDVNHGRYLSCMNALWHPECFRCRGCNHPISDYEFSVYESYPYHKSCYEEAHHPRCDVCRHIIPTNAAGLIEYSANPFWSQKYCSRHEHDGTPRCCSCERKESWNTRFTALNDGRKLCVECLNSAIMNTKDCQPLFHDIQKFFEGLNMKVRWQIPLLLVERPALIEAMGGEMHGHHHHHMPDTRGLCLAEEHTFNTVRASTKLGFGKRTTSMKTQPLKINRHCKVTAILILYGLPRLLTGIILAHEMTHAWLRLNGYQDLSQEVEEGMCQVIANMWLEFQIEAMSDTTSSRHGMTSPFETKLGEFFKHQIATDSSAIYGNGFRAGHQAVVQFGLQRTLDHIRKNQHFPS